VFGSLSKINTRAIIGTSLLGNTKTLQKKRFTNYNTAEMPVTLLAPNCPRPRCIPGTSVQIQAIFLHFIFQFYIVKRTQVTKKYPFRHFCKLSSFVEFYYTMPVTLLAPNCPSVQIQTVLQSFIE